MKKIILLTLFLVINLPNLYSQYKFQQLIGGPDHERAQTVFSTFDNCFIINAATFSFGSGNVDAMLIKMDSTGQLIWSKTYGGIDYDNAEYAIQSFDHNIICAGRSSVSAGAPTSAILFKTDSAGNLNWNKSFGGSANDGFVHFVETFDRGFASVGYSNSLSSGLADILFIRTDSNGDTLFTRSYGTAEQEAGSGIFQLPDSGFILTGRQTTISSGGSPVADGLLIRTDANGNMLWSKLYGDSLFEELTSIKLLPDGGFIICGSTTTFGHGGFDILLMKTDSTGNPLWTKTFGGAKTDAAYDIHVNSDNSFVLSGYTESLGYGHTRVSDSTNVFLLKTDENGALIWMEVYGDGLQDEAYRSNLAPDGGYVISGFSSSYLLNDSTQIFIIKTDSTGITGCHEESAIPPDSLITMPFQTIILSQLSGIALNTPTFNELTANPTNDDACLFSNVSATSSHNTEIIAFPNPFKNTIHYKFDGISVEGSLIISDSYGRIFKHLPINQPEGEINLEELANGFYLLSLFDKKYSMNVKCIKLIKKSN